MVHKYRYRYKILAAILLVILFLPLYIYKLGTIPTNITGDESTYLGISYRILYSPKRMSLVAFPEDTKPAVNFYWTALWIKMLGTKNTVFAMRFGIVLISIATLLIFFILLSKRVTFSISFLTTLLLGTNILYLNFSRSGWYNLGSILIGLLMIFFIEKAITSKKKEKYFVAAGIMGGLCFYTYLSGIIFPISAIIYLIWKYITRGKPKLKSRQIAIFIATLILTVVPLLISIFNNKISFLLRPNVVFIFNNTKINGPLSALRVLSDQIVECLRGLVLMDGSVVGKGIENIRYFPVGESLLDMFSCFIFLTGLFLIITKRLKVKGIGMWVLSFIVTIFTVGALTIDAPNLARTITILPFIYYVIGVTANYIITKLTKNIDKSVVILVFTFVVLLIGIYNVSKYFSWAKSDDLALARQPAIDYSEFIPWQNYQIERIKRGGLPITNYQWYQIRKVDIQPTPSQQY